MGSGRKSCAGKQLFVSSQFNLDTFKSKFITVRAQLENKRDLLAPVALSCKNDNCRALSEDSNIICYR